MKKIINCAFLLFLAGTLSAQIGDVISVSSTSFSVQNNKDLSQAAKAMGSPYITQEFLPAVITGHDKSINLRYNAYTDEMEFKMNQVDYNLSKEEYPEVFIGPEKTRYIYTSYTDGKTKVSGFLRTIAEHDKVAFYIKESITYTPAVASSNGYGSDKPAIYKRAKDRLFVKVNGNIIEMPTNKKKFAALFSENEKQISSYISSEKIALTKETDLLKLGRFIQNL